MNFYPYAMLCVPQCLKAAFVKHASLHYCKVKSCLLDALIVSDWDLKTFEM